MSFGVVLNLITLLLVGIAVVYLVMSAMGLLQSVNRLSTRLNRFETNYQVRTQISAEKDE